MEDPKRWRSESHGAGRRDLAWLAAALALALAVAACDSGPSYSAETVAAGEATFDRVCATCHGADAKGLPRLGKGLLANEFVKAHDDVELISFLKVGRSAGDPLNVTGVDMPPKGGDPTITEADLANVVAFLRTLQ